MAAPSHGPADPAEADNSKGFAGNMRAHHVGRAPAAPLVFAQVPFAFARAPRRHEQQSQRQIGGRFGQHARCIGHGDAALFCRLDVDVIEADAEVTHEAGLQRFGGQDLGIDPIGHRGQHGISLGEGGFQLVLG